MCGLAVTVSFDGRPADLGVLNRMAHVLRHRGPDDSGTASYGHVGFAFRRLAILDLTPAGHQPMETADGHLAIVFNGEIFNYLELREQLKGYGHTFRTNSDTEVLLASYRQWGRECVSRLNGMWAFVIYDTARRQLFASRDRFGIKPLYQYLHRGTLMLASEVKAIVAAVGATALETNWQAASKFLVRGRLDDDEQTFFRGIEQLPAGSTLEVESDGRMSARQFWSLSSVSPLTPAEAEDAPARFHALLRDSVRLRMRSDVPVGVCLSGGIDSNAIISFMAEMWPDAAHGRMQAFSYIPQEFSEAEYIQATITKTGAELNTLDVSPERLWQTLPTALWHYDGPVHSATALIGFELMRLARSRAVKVVLNGQGADEVNAGYHEYFRNYWSDLIGLGRARLAWREVQRYAAAHRLQAGALFRDAAGISARRLLEKAPGYLALAALRRTTRLRTHPWYLPDLTRQVDVADTAAAARGLDAALRYSVERRPLPIYLRVEDRNSMAHSVEARLPFLDYRLVSLAFALPPAWKLRGPWNKFVVREATKGVIADTVRTRLDKMGFPTPARRWFGGPWYEPFRDLLGSSALRHAGFLDVAAVERDLVRHRAGEADASTRLFHLAQFGIWLDGAGKSAPTRTGDAPHPLHAPRSA